MSSKQSRNSLGRGGLFGDSKPGTGFGYSSDGGFNFSGAGLLPGRKTEVLGRSRSNLLPGKEVLMKSNVRLFSSGGTMKKFVIPRDKDGDGSDDDIISRISRAADKVASLGDDPDGGQMSISSASKSKSAAASAPEASGEPSPASESKSESMKKLEAGRAKFKAGLQTYEEMKAKYNKKYGSQAERETIAAAIKLGRQAAKAAKEGKEPSVLARVRGLGAASKSAKAAKAAKEGKEGDEPSVLARVRAVGASSKPAKSAKAAKPAGNKSKPAGPQSAPAGAPEKKKKPSAVQVESFYGNPKDKILDSQAQVVKDLAAAKAALADSDKEEIEISDGEEVQEVKEADPEAAEKAAEKALENSVVNLTISTEKLKALFSDATCEFKEADPGQNKGKWDISDGLTQEDKNTLDSGVARDLIRPNAANKLTRVYIFPTSQNRSTRAETIRKSYGVTAASFAPDKIDLMNKPGIPQAIKLQGGGPKKNNKTAYIFYQNYP